MEGNFYDEFPFFELIYVILSLLLSSLRFLVLLDPTQWCSAEWSVTLLQTRKTKYDLIFIIKSLGPFYQAQSSCRPSRFATLNCAMSTPSIPPTLAIVFGRRLSQKITGYINFNTGEFPIFSWGQDLYRPSSSTSLGLVRKSNNSSINFDIQAGVAHSSVSLAYNKGLDNLGDIGKGLRMRCSVKADTSVSLMMSVGADKRIGNFGRFGYGVDFTLSGIVFRLRYVQGVFFRCCW